MSDRDEMDEPKTWRIVGRVLMSIGMGLGFGGAAFVRRDTDVGLPMLIAGGALLVAGAVLARNARRKAQSRTGYELGHGEPDFDAMEYRREKERERR
jgi:hypothetical protein